MVITYNNNTEIVNSFKDCLELLNPEFAEAIEYFHENGDNTEALAERHELLQQEFNSYEASLESRDSCLMDVKETIEQLKNKIENAKRLNRDEIIDYLKSIIITIHNEI